MAPKLVTPYRMSGKRGKNDAADAAAICEAAAPPEHALRAGEDRGAAVAADGAPRAPGFVAARTATHQPHPRTAHRVRRRAAAEGRGRARLRRASTLEDLPGYANLVIGDLLSEVHHLDERIAQYDMHIRTMARQCTAAQQLMQLMGVGETTATAIVAMVGNARRVRQRAAVRRLDGPGAGPVQLGRQVAAGAHHQGRRRLPAQLAGAGRPGGAQCGGNKTDPLSRWAMKLRRAPRLLEGRGGDCGEERAHGLGGADPGRGVQAAGVK